LNRNSIAGAETRPYMPETYSTGEPRVPMAATGPVKMILKLPPYLAPPGAGVVVVAVAVGLAVVLVGADVVEVGAVVVVVGAWVVVVGWVVLVVGAVVAPPEQAANRVLKTTASITRKYTFFIYSSLNINTFVISRDILVS